MVPHCFLRELSSPPTQVFPGTSLAIFRGLSCDNNFDLTAPGVTGEIEYGDAYVQKYCVGMLYPASQNGKGSDGVIRCFASYLKYDYGLDCNSEEYLNWQRYYCYFMILIYPIGIPLM